MSDLKKQKTIKHQLMAMVLRISLKKKMIFLLVSNAAYGKLVVIAN